MKNLKKILVIGAGLMGKEYLLALEDLKFEKIAVLTNTDSSADRIKKIRNVGLSFSGGINTLSKIYNNYDFFIIACPIENLFEYLIFLQKKNKKILVEKPVVLESKKISDFIKKYPDNKVVPALNRLYFPSVSTLRKILEKKKITSANFSFTEWTEKINHKIYGKKVLSKWGISNSIHVIYTIFDLIGYPKVLETFTGGEKKIKWHSSGSIFLGSGISERNIPFSYHSDWTSAGRWGIKINTDEGTFILEPMEELAFQKKNSLEKKKIVSLWSGKIKCGLTEMLNDWLFDKPSKFKPSLLTVEQSIKTTENIIYQKN